MDEEADIYYIDTRNATVAGSSGRRPQPGQPQPAGRMFIQSTGGQRPMNYPAGQPMIYPAGQPMAYGPNTPQVIYVPQSGALGGLFGKLTTGQVIDMVAQVFAVLQPLPAPPNALGDAAADVGNSIKYQEALAEYAKRDEQVRTIGNLISKLVG